MCIAQICPGDQFSIHPDVPYICSVSFVIIRVFHSCTMILCAYNRLFSNSIIHFGDFLTVLIILQFDHSISCIFTCYQISLCIIITRFHPISIFIHIFVGGIPAFFTYDRLILGIHITSCQCIPLIVICIPDMCIAQITADHWFPIQPDIPELCVVALFVLYVFCPGIAIFCTDNRLFICPVIGF